MKNFNPLLKKAAAKVETLGRMRKNAPKIVEMPSRTPRGLPTTFRKNGFCAFPRAAIHSPGASERPQPNQT
jgi:hypothetical protein